MMDKNRRYLFRFLVKQDIKRRYQGSVLGILWSVFVPLLMLAIYTFIFSEVFKVKWNIETDNKFEFALMLFCGISLYNMYADVLGRSVGLIAQNQNYVKKVVFPLEVLPGIITFSALFNCVICYIILIVGNLILSGHLYLTVLLTPVVLLPHIILCLGVSYLFSAISVYIKDLENFVSVLITVGMYLLWNPMTYTIENMRNVIIYGTQINWGFYVISWVSAFLIFIIGYWVFKRAKFGFADLL